MFTGIHLPEFILVLLVVCCVYFGYTAYASFKYKKNLFTKLVKGIVVGLLMYLVLYIIGIPLIRHFTPGVGDDVIYNSYTVTAILGNIFFFTRKKFYEGMGILISLPLSVILLFIFVTGPLFFRT